MTVQDHRGIVLNFSEPRNVYELIKVTHFKPGKTPEMIGSIERVMDEKTDTVIYRAYNQYREPLGAYSTDWQEIEERFQKYAHNQSRSELEQAWLRVVNRNNELRAIRKEKTTGREINR